MAERLTSDTASPDNSAWVSLLDNALYIGVEGELKAPEGYYTRRDTVAPGWVIEWADKKPIGVEFLLEELQWEIFSGRLHATHRRPGDLFRITRPSLTPADPRERAIIELPERIRLIGHTSDPLKIITLEIPGFRAFIKKHPEAGALKNIIKAARSRVPTSPYLIP